MMTYPRNLPGLSYAKVRRPQHAVSVQSHQSGGEVRMSYWSEPLWQWDLTYELLRDGRRDGRDWDELRQIQGLFLACTGSLAGFQFHDDDDWRVFRQPVATTVSGVASYDLVRSIGANDPALGLFGTGHIGCVDTLQPFRLYVDGSTTPVAISDPVFGFSVSTATPVKQQLMFNASPPAGHVLSVDMSYFHYVRFQANSLDFEKFMHQLWTLNKVTLQSLRF
ncbi:MAG TPA: DUF2460 domain-containing protein [Rhizomicrobium sp.]|jgi:hypothetical protein